MFDAKTRIIGLPYGEKNYDNMLSRFHTIAERTGRTDRRTDRFAISRSRVRLASEPAEKWGGIVRRAKGRGLGRGYAPVQLGVWGLAPRKFLLKSSFFALKLRNSEQICALSRQVNVLSFSLFAS